MKPNILVSGIFALSMLMPSHLLAQQSTNGLSLNDLWQCADSLQSGNDPSESLEGGMECAVNAALDAVMDTGITHLNTQGKEFFGRGFSITNTMRYAPFDGKRLQGDIDMVLPLSFGDTNANQPHRAWFMQNGLTRWTDSHGLRRNDSRFGFAHRFTTSRDNNGNANLLGAYTLLQQNLERGHKRLVFGFDYTGRWGKGFINHYNPESDWLAGRAGYQERAIGGSEVGVKITPTTAIDLNLTAGEWETSDSDKQFRGRLGLAWQPHTYWRLDSAMGGLGTGDSQVNINMTFTMPLGRQETPARWNGLGLAATSTATPDHLWKTVTVNNRIEVIERKEITSVDQLVSTAKVRFLQASAASGNEIGLEITLANPAPQDMRVVVQLRPGSGANPAVAGVDYPATPIEVLIPHGTTTATATLNLLDNPNITEGRSLSVAIHAIGGGK